MPGLLSKVSVSVDYRRIFPGAHPMLKCKYMFRFLKANLNYYVFTNASRNRTRVR